MEDMIQYDFCKPYLMLDELSLIHIYMHGKTLGSALLEMEI